MNTTILLTTGIDAEIGKRSQLVQSWWDLWCVQSGRILPKQTQRQRFECEFFFLRSNPRRHLVLSSKLQLRELGASSYWGILGVGVEQEPQRQPTPGYIITPQSLRVALQGVHPCSFLPALNTRTVAVSATKGWPQARGTDSRMWKSRLTAQK